MASKFKIWVDDDHLNKVQAYEAFANDTQRTAGFTGGTPASSERVNTALRQANLVACALMEIVDPGGTVDFRSNVTSIQTLINSYLNTSLKVSSATNADNANIRNLNTSNNAVVNFQIGDGAAYNKTINNVANVTTTINEKNITDIFETDGTTAKNATNATNATNSITATTADKANKIVFVTTPPTESPEEGTLVIYVSSSIPTTRYDRVLYLMTY